MSMTGLGGGRPQQGDFIGNFRPKLAGVKDYLSGLGGRPLGGGVGGGGAGSGVRLQLRNEGGHMYGRAHGGNLYNVNELGPESVYQNGSYTRSNLPQTIPPNPTGYVAPNITGRAIGGDLRDGAQRIDYGGDFDIRSQESPPAPPYTGTTIDNNTGQPVGGGVGSPLTNRAAPENPGGVAGGYNFMTDPGYNFRIGEGQRAMERGAAAAGGLLSGGYGRRLTRYAQDYASNEYTNVYNRISNIAGLGQVSAGQSGQAALYAGAGMGTAAAQGASARASGYQAGTNAWANAANQLGQLPWGDLFNRSTTTPRPT
jgi:hypothetical protein